MSYYQGLINKYREYLPVNEYTPVVTLNEGNTPLIKADNLAREIQPDVEIYLKFEGCNPTGSFKDRGMTLAVTKAKEDGSNALRMELTSDGLHLKEKGYKIWSDALRKTL